MSFPEANEKLPYQLYLADIQGVYMEEVNGCWQLPSDREHYNDTETRARMVELLSRVPVSIQKNEIYGAKVYVITNNGQKIRIVAVGADQRLLDGERHLGGKFIPKDFIPQDDSVQLWTQQNVAALLEEQARQRLAARLSDGFLPPCSGYRLVLTAGNETFPYILLDQAKDEKGSYLRLPGDDNDAIGSTKGSEAMKQLLTAYRVTTGIFTTHEQFVGGKTLLFFVAHVNVMPAGNGDKAYRKCHVPDGKQFVPLTADILEGVGFAQSTQLALQKLRDEAHAIHFKQAVPLSHYY